MEYEEHQKLIKQHESIMKQAQEGIKVYDKWGFVILLLLAIPFLQYIGILILLVLLGKIEKALTQLNYSKGYIDGANNIYFEMQKEK